jgi:hypothetical protein
MSMKPELRVINSAQPILMSEAFMSDAARAKAISSDILESHPGHLTHTGFPDSTKGIDELGQSWCSEGFLETDDEIFADAEFIGMERTMVRRDLPTDRAGETMAALAACPVGRRQLERVTAAARRQFGPQAALARSVEDRDLAEGEGLQDQEREWQSELSDGGVAAETVKLWMLTPILLPVTVSPAPPALLLPAFQIPQLDDGCVRTTLLVQPALHPEEEEVGLALRQGCARYPPNSNPLAGPAFRPVQPPPSVARLPPQPPPPPPPPPPPSDAETPPPWPSSPGPAWVATPPPPPDDGGDGEGEWWGEWTPERVDIPC